MASFKKFLTYTAVTAAAVAGGIAVYKKVQANKATCDDDFDEFDDDIFDDDFDDDFDDTAADGRNYTSITPEEAVSTEDVAESVVEDTDADTTADAAQDAEAVADAE